MARQSIAREAATNSTQNKFMKNISTKMSDKNASERL
jgi:hypothetical protein